MCAGYRLRRYALRGGVSPFGRYGLLSPRYVLDMRSVRGEQQQLKDQEEEMELKKWPDDFHTGLFELAKGGNLNVQELKERWNELMEFKRKHLPKSLLRFRPIENDNELKFRQSEIDGELCFRDIRILNDPFDSLLQSVKDDPSLNNVVKSVNMELRNSGYIVCFNEYREDIEETKNMVETSQMWDHYAKDHRGCCMVYDPSSWGAEWQDALFPVYYRKEHQEFINNFKRSKDDDREWSFNSYFFNKYIMTHKLTCWSHEREWRIILDKNLIKRLYDKGCDIRLLTKKFKRPISLNEDLKDYSCEKIMVDRFKCFLDTDGPIIQNNYSYDCSVKGMPLRDNTPEFESILIDFKKTFKDNCFEKTFKIIFGNGIVSNDRNELIKYCQKYPDIALFDMIINDYNEFIPQQVKVKDNGE